MLLKRTCDIAGVLMALSVFAIPMVIVALAVRTTSQGPALYWLQRMGCGNRLFSMPRSRTMRTNTPVVATHLLGGAARHLTPIGRLLRKTSLDEPPQLWCILNGDMSFAGPRPALFNQDDLVATRTTRNVHTLLPGLTGWLKQKGEMSPQSRTRPRSTPKISIVGASFSIYTF
jgi:O-antigen biosynthesis protein WbqP